MNRIWHLLLLAFCGCVADRSDLGTYEFDTAYALEKIEVYSDSTLELIQTSYPTDEIIWIRDYDEIASESMYYLKQNGQILWSANMEDYEIYKTDIDDLPVTFDNVEYASSLVLRDGIRLLLFYITDRLYIVDRSKFFGAYTLYEDNGVNLLDNEVYICFRKVN